MTRCTGQIGHDQCANCKRLALRAMMRPIVKLGACKFYEPKPKRQSIDLVPYAGKPKC